MKTPPAFACLLALLAASCRLFGAESVFPAFTPPGENIAKGKPYTVKVFYKTEDLPATKDEGDATQLTDGEYATTGGRALWTRKGTVGWIRGPIAITIDLGPGSEGTPIAGVSFSTASGPVSGMGFPPAIMILVSDDGQTFTPAGELVALSTKFGPAREWHSHRFVTDELNARGRYVQVVAQSSLHVICDEIEIYRGRETAAPPAPSASDVRATAQAAAAQATAAARAKMFARTDTRAKDKTAEEATAPAPAVETNGVSDGVEWLCRNIMPYSISARIANDTAQMMSLLPELALSEDNQAGALRILEQLRVKALAPQPGDYGPTFRAIVPLNPLHAELFAVLGRACRLAGYNRLMVWHTDRWARLTPFDLPPRPGSSNVTDGVVLKVRMMRNERRGETLNIANFGDQAMSALVRFRGLPGGDCPPYLEVRQAEYVAMQSRFWDADVLPRAGRQDKGGWQVSLPAGLTRQLWLDFRLDAVDCRPGTYQGAVLLQTKEGVTLTVPLELTVLASALPKERAVGVGVWDYSDQDGYGNLQAVIHGAKGNLEAGIAHMRESGLNAPWARAGYKNAIFPREYPNLFDAEGNLVNPPNFSAFDAWVDAWPNAKFYMVNAFAMGGFDQNPGEAYDAAELTEAQRKEGALMKAWAAHMRERGIDPAKVVIQFVDEPRWTSQARPAYYWARAVKEAVPEFKIFVNSRVQPDYYDKPEIRKLLDLADIIAPGTDYDYQRHGRTAVDFYEGYRQKGKIMGFYACAQNPSEAESTRYYRLQSWACWQISGGGRDTYSGFWGYSDFRSGRCWNTLAGGSGRNWCPAYLDDTSATDGKHWLAIFEGAQDYEYLLMLKDTLAAARQAGRNDAAVEAAQKLLDTLPGEVINSVRHKDDQSACDVARLRILDALEALR